MKWKSEKAIVEIKGYGDELSLLLDENSPFDQLELELENLLHKSDSKSFFEGSSIVINSNRILKDEELSRIEFLLKQEGNLRLKKIDKDKQYSQKDIQSKSLENMSNLENQRNKKEIGIVEYLIGQGFQAEESVIIKQTLRSGQNIRSRKSVILLGDINPGAEVISAKDIIVLGTLRGMAHAGATGDIESKIISLKMQPTQIRIADIVTRPPVGDKSPSVPEIAFVEDNHIVMEEFPKVRK